MSRRASAAPQSIFDYPHQLPLVHVNHPKFEPADTDASLRGARDYLSNKTRKVKMAVAGPWSQMKDAIKHDRLDIVKDLFADGFNALEKYSSKGKKVTALEYAMMKKASSDIIEYLAQRVKLQKEINKIS